MGAVQFTATRALLVTSGTVVDLDVGFFSYTPRYVKVGSVSTSLNGTRESILHRIDERIAVATTFHTPADRAAINQWIQSVMNSEQWSIDPTGSVATPVAPVNVRMLAETFVEAPLARDRYRLTFDVVRV